MPTVRVKRRSHTRCEQGGKAKYGVGDTFEASESEAKAFADRLEVVEPESEPAKLPNPEPRDEREADLRELSMKELRELAKVYPDVDANPPKRKVEVAAALYDAGAEAPVEDPEPRDEREAALRALGDDELIALADSQEIELTEGMTAVDLAAKLYDAGVQAPE